MLLVAVASSPLMRYGVYLPNFDMFGEATVMVDLARLAEAAGWDGFFIWDHLQWPGNEPAVDPWVALGAMAVSTEQIRLGTMVTPLPRRDIVKLARETVSVDRLSGGRLVLGAGLGWESIPEWGAFGHESDKRVRGDMLDEGLDVLTALWTGDPVEHDGAYYRVATEGMAPPVQRPRIPIWVGGGWPAKKPFRRAAMWDGVMPISSSEGTDLTPGDITDIRAFIEKHRSYAGSFDVIKSGSTAHASDADRPRGYAEAGATWWLESIVPWGNSLEAAKGRIRSGPPR
jgi:alkanesulfonate monooxygenase SsuD/methylene tetrahydromethanopterin reductase-like flavin-dependent oxidoreductase (luciferase family)